MSLITAGAIAQNGGVNHYSSTQLRQMAQTLKEKKDLPATGAAGETLEKYPGHFTMLTVRTASGGAEVHEHYADIFFVVDGDATLTTGGTVLNAAITGPGETRGSAIQGGVQQKLGTGDVIHISSNTPHQLSIAKGHSFTYFVVKVKE